MLTFFLFPWINIHGNINKADFWHFGTAFPYHVILSKTYFLWWFLPHLHPHKLLLAFLFTHQQYVSKQDLNLACRQAIHSCVQLIQTSGFHSGSGINHRSNFMAVGCNTRIKPLCKDHGSVEWEFHLTSFKLEELSDFNVSKFIDALKKTPLSSWCSGCPLMKSSLHINGQSCAMLGSPWAFTCQMYAPWQGWNLSSILPEWQVLACLPPLLPLCSPG